MRSILRIVAIYAASVAIHLIYLWVESFAPSGSKNPEEFPTLLVFAVPLIFGFDWDAFSRLRKEVLLYLLSLFGCVFLNGFMVGFFGHFDWPKWFCASFATALGIYASLEFMKKVRLEGAALPKTTPTE